jgi:hypothetical protein
VACAGAIDLPGETHFLTQTSDETSRRRIKPEPVVIGSRAFVYYSAPSSILSTQGIYMTRFYGRPSDPPPVDNDQDGLSDDEDNCITVFNPSQAATNGDCIGNSCGAHTTDDCVGNFGDLALMRSAFFTADADYDLTGGGPMMTEQNGLVNFLDLGVMKSKFFELTHR